jgi:hypothetical protein
MPRPLQAKLWLGTTRQRVYYCGPRCQKGNPGLGGEINSEEARVSQEATVCV